MAKEVKTPAEAVANVPAADESTFDVTEIAANAPHLFGYSVDMATAAFAVNHINRCTLEEARKTIQAFAERKVN